MTILVTGATGLAGSAVIREFVRRNEPVRALIRDSAKAATLGRAANVDIVEGDMLRPETLGPALEGVHRVLMISSADTKLAETQQAFIDAAKTAGVPHIVKVSGLGCAPGWWRPAAESDFIFGRMHAEVERYLEASGMAWTHLRPSQFMPVYFREIPTIMSEDAFYLPMGDARLAAVDIGDVAAAAHALLHGEGHEEKGYSMTGPEALTMTEVAERISSVIGRPVRYVNIDPVEKTNRLVAAGLPAGFAQALDDLFAERRAGGAESSVDLSTHEALGVTPTSFEEFAERNAAVFRGDAPHSHLWASGRLTEDSASSDERNVRANSPS